jgi:hypothetical protein
MQFCAGVCSGGQNQPLGHSEHEYPAVGHGCVDVGEPARYEAEVEALSGLEDVLVNMELQSFWRFANTPFAHAIKGGDGGIVALAGGR